MDSVGPIKALYDALSPVNPVSSAVNSALDNLTTEAYAIAPVPPLGPIWLDAMQICCSKIDSESPLLLAKCANIFLKLFSSGDINMTQSYVDFVVNWACQCLSTAPDIVYIDFLKMLDALMKRGSVKLEHEWVDLFDVLTVKMEDKARVSSADDILQWRMMCLKTISPNLPSHCLYTVAASYFEVISSLTRNHSPTYCQVWIAALDGLEVLCSLSSEWVQPVLQHLVLAIHTGMTIGVHVASSLMLKFPAHNVIPSPGKLPPTRPAVRLKRKNKGKIKHVAWTENEKHNTCDENRGQTSYTTTSWVTSSDSEFSDSEMDKTKQAIKKLEAHVRHSAYNLLIHVVKLVGCKSVFEWYCALLSRLIDAIQFETYSKPRCAVFGAVTTLLSGAKMFLAQAQESERQSFTSFSDVLAAQLTGLHSAIVGSLGKVSISDRQQLTALSLATGALIKVTPYHRLNGGLFNSLYAAIQSLARTEEPFLVSCLLQCLLEVVIRSPPFVGVAEAIAEPAGSEPWIIQYTLAHLNENANGVRKFSWCVVSGLCQCHFSLIEPHLTLIEEHIVRDMAANTERTPPLKALASLLDKYLTESRYNQRANDLWDHLLDPNSSFLLSIQDPGKTAAAACDCFALIGFKKFHTLTEEKKILIITLVLGCCSNELPLVRYAALNVLSNLLSYPEMCGEVQFILDAKDHLIRALKDPVESVRSKAAWALSNLVDLLVENKDDDELIREVSIFELLQAMLSLSADTPKVKQNILRAVGHLSLLVTAKDLESAKWREALEKGCSVLQLSAASGTVMKMRWNACRAIATMLSNEELYEVLQPAIAKAIKTLCTIVISCNNFKVRMNACLALSSVKQRRLYGVLYIHVWQSLLDGLDNAANMPDFSEFKHQHGLLENLCLAVCRMACFVEPGDLSVLSEMFPDHRLNSLSAQLAQCHERVAPERAGALLEAVAHLENVTKQSKSSDNFANKLLNAFQVTSQISDY